MNLFGEEQVVFNVSRIDNSSKKAASPFTKTTTIIDHTFQIANYAPLDNIVQAGAYTFPFSLLLPAWLPRSSLCIHTDETKDKKEAHQVSITTFQFRVFYELSVRVNALVSASAPNQPPQVFDDMLCTERITLYEAPIRDALLNQKFFKEYKLSKML